MIYLDISEFMQNTLDLQFLILTDYFGGRIYQNNLVGTEKAPKL